MQYVHRVMVPMRTTPNVVFSIFADYLVGVWMVVVVKNQDILFLLAIVLSCFNIPISP